MKRTVEYMTYNRGALSTEEFLNKKAEERWELVTITPYDYYIFRRPVEDRFYKELTQYMEDVQYLIEAGGEDKESNEGLLRGLRHAFQIYTGQ